MDKTWRIVAGLAFLALAWPACGQAVAPLAQADNEFAIDLYGQLRGQSGNLFFSPYSVATAVGMVFAGARGKTADEMAGVLHVRGSQADYLARERALRAAMPPDGAFALTNANALWGAQGYAFHRDYIARMREDFGGDLRVVEFDDPVAASARINDWVGQRTEGHIRDLVPVSTLDRSTVLALTNATYFNADWQKPFKPEDTQQMYFQVAPGRSLSTPGMNLTDHFDITVADDAKILIMPYVTTGAEPTSMVIILPDRRDGLAAIEQGLTEMTLNGWISDAKNQLVDIQLPKFRQSGRYDMDMALAALGARQLFNPDQADLTGIAKPRAGRRLYVGDVIHEAQVDVDENGTEASAATAMTTLLSLSGPQFPPPQPIEFIADHPFIYAIIDQRTGVILFMGREADPTEGGG